MAAVVQRAATSSVPVDFPPWQTVYWYSTRWEEDRLTERMLVVLRRRVRAAHGRAEEPSAGIIDSQSIKGADTVPRTSRGYDAGKKMNGRKRFIVTDTLGLLLVVCVMAAGVQDRDGAKATHLSAYLFTPVRFVYADAGFAGVLVNWCQRILRTTLEVVRKAPGQRGVNRTVPDSNVLSGKTCTRARPKPGSPRLGTCSVRWRALGGASGAGCALNASQCRWR
ncbi:transposase [Micromonospora sp. IBSANI012]|uniref:transposase n=1 Tax=Micromonospora sp. IBSANI012 TaxID=3457761 RepID=UPI004058668D